MIRVELQDAEARAALERLDASLADLTPVMRDIGRYLTKATKQRFQAGQGPDGTAWAPKTQTTRDAQSARGDRPDPRPLIGPSRALSTTIFYIAGPDQVEVGSPAIYSAVHQFGAAAGAFGATSRGAPIPWGDIPARPFLGIAPADRDAIIDIVEEWLDSVADG